MSEQRRTEFERKQAFVADAIQRYGNFTGGSLLSALIDRVLTPEARVSELEVKKNEFAHCRTV
jgi:hypothetical protein